MRFLCDHMLVRLGRWLRAAGYDTLIANPTDDDASLLAKAQEEERLLITRDRLIRGEKDILYLQSNSVEECAQELSQKIPIDWLKAPFSRCLLCNEPLKKVQDAEDIPADVKNSCDEFWRCPNCEKTYWEGSHTKRMMRQLKQWQK